MLQLCVFYAVVVFSGVVDTKSEDMTDKLLVHNENCAPHNGIPELELNPYFF